VGDSVRRVLFVDDDPMILDVLRVLLAREDFEVHTARSPDDGRRILAEKPIDVLVVDAHMPRTSGVDLLREVREKYPDVVRVMLTGSGDRETAVLAVNDGAVFRFLLKPPDPVALRQALADALDHGDKKRKEAKLVRITLEQQAIFRELYAAPGDSPSPVRSPEETSVPSAVSELLSPREVEVALALVRAGDADGVARALGMSPHTVRTHLKSMFRKLEVHSQSALVSRLYGLGVRP